MATTPPSLLDDILNSAPAAKGPTQPAAQRSTFDDLLDAAPPAGGATDGPKPPTPFALGGFAGPVPPPARGGGAPAPPIVGPSTVVPVAPHAPLVPAGPQPVPQIQADEPAPVAPIDHSTPQGAIMLDASGPNRRVAGQPMGPITGLAQPPADKNDPVQALVDVRNLILGPAYGAKLKSDSGVESLVNAFVRAGASFNTPEGVAMMATTAGLGTALPELLGSAKAVQMLAEHPVLLKGLRLASKGAVPTAFATMGGASTAQNLYEGIKSGNREQIAQGIADLAIAGFAGYHAVRSVADEMARLGGRLSAEWEGYAQAAKEGKPIDLIEKLRAMAGQNEQSPQEAGIARKILRDKYGIDIPEPAARSVADMTDKELAETAAREAQEHPLRDPQDSAVYQEYAKRRAARDAGMAAGPATPEEVLAQTPDAPTSPERTPPGTPQQSSETAPVPPTEVVSQSAPEVQNAQPTPPSPVPAKPVAGTPPSAVSVAPSAPAQEPAPAVPPAQTAEPSAAIPAPVAAQPDPNESVQDKSWREWAENFTRVSANPTAASEQDLRRAIGFLDNRRRSIIRRAQEAGQLVDANVLAGYDNESEYYLSLIKQHEAARTPKPVPPAPPRKEAIPAAKPEAVAETAGVKGAPPEQVAPPGSASISPTPETAAETPQASPLQSAAGSAKPESTRVGEGENTEDAHQKPTKTAPDEAKNGQIPEIHSHGSTQVNLPDDVADKVRAVGASIPDDILTPDGRETQPHITVRFGNNEKNSSRIEKALQGQGPITAKVKTLSIFPNVDTEHGKADVLKLDIDSPELHRLNKLVGESVPHPGETHPKYSPHITVAYVKVGEGKKYAGRSVPGLSGQAITFNAVHFSPAEGEMTAIPLKSATKVEEASTQVVAPAKAKKPTALARAKADRARIKDFYTPGNVVTGYGGAHDKVLAFEEQPSGGFRVQVQEIEKDGKLGRPRWHATPPDKSYKVISRAETKPPATETKPAPTETKAPVTEEAPAKAETKPRVEVEPSGKPTEVYTTSGRKVATAFDVRESSDLTNSFDSGYPQEYQPRDTGRQGSRQRVEQRKGDMNAALMADSRLASDGAPIILKDGAVITRNHGTQALKELYQQKSPKAAQYKAWVEEHAAEFGIDPQAVAAMKQPVLVRAITDAMKPTDVVEFAQEANMASAARMSDAEMADMLARRMSGKLMDLFDPTEDGRINSEFVRELVKDLPVEEQSVFQDKEGKVSQTGARIIRNAISAKAYPDPRALERMAESESPSLKNVTSGMLAAAPGLARFEEAALRGDRFPVGIGREIADAASVMDELVRTGTPVAVWLDQGEMFGRDPVVESLVRVFSDNRRSSKRIGEFLKEYTEGAEAVGSPRQETMFGPPEAPEKADVLEAAYTRVQERWKPQQDLFAQPATETELAGSGLDRKQAEAEGPDEGPAALQARRPVKDEAPSLFDEPAPEKRYTPPIPTHKLSGYNQADLMDEGAIAKSKAEQQAYEDRLLGDRLTAQMKSGMAARPPKLKPAETRDLFAQDEPDQGGLFEGPDALQSRRPTPAPAIPGKPPRLQESPVPAGDFPTLKEAKAYWDGAVAQPETMEGQPVLWVNGSAMDIILSRMGMTGSGQDSTQTIGLTMTPGEWQSVLDEAHAATKDPRPGGFDDALVRIGEQIKPLIQKNRKAAIVVVQAGPQHQSQLQRTLNEELDHAKQMQLPKGLRGLPVEMLESPEGEKAVDALVKVLGYRRPDPKSPFYEHNRAVMTAEIGVRLMRGGRYQELGLTAEEAVELAAQYIEGLERENGANADQIIEQTYASIEQNKAAYSGRSKNLDVQHQTGAERAPQGRSQGATESPEGAVSGETGGSGPVAPLRASSGSAFRNLQNQLAGLFRGIPEPSIQPEVKPAWVREMEEFAGMTTARPEAPAPLPENSHQVYDTETGRIRDHGLTEKEAKKAAASLTDLTGAEHAHRQVDTRPEPSEEFPHQIKESRLAQGVEKNAVAEGLTEGFEGRPEYRTVNIKEQAQLAADLIARDLPKAISIAMGDAVPPGELLPESVFVAVENYATERGDVELLRQLAQSSSLSMEATGMGQRIRMLGERRPNSPVEAMKKVAEAREAASTKRNGPKAKEKAKAEIKESIKTANRKKSEWSSFLESIKC